MNIFEKAKAKFGGWYYPQPVPSNNLKVAIFSPNTKGIAKGIKDGFVRRIEQETSRAVNFHSFDTIAGRSSEIIKNLDQVHHQKFDLLFTVGASCTKSAATYLQTLHSKVPIVCSAIPQNLFEAEVLPQNLTGVMGESTDKKPKHLERYFMIRPETSHVLFLYDFLAKMSQEDCKKIELAANLNRRYFSQFNAQNFSAKKFVDLISTSFPRIDTVLLSRDHQTHAIASHVAELCNTLNITLMSFDSYSVLQGASLGFGPREEMSGEAAAEKALLILKDKVEPSQLPLSNTNLKYKLTINSHTMHQQNLNIDSGILLAMKHLEMA